MKLIDMTCPHCGANLKVDADQNTAVCEYCGSALLIDDDIQRVRYENAEAAGYEFEKGRQRALEEWDALHPPVRPSHRRTWLWVLGWIFIFPVPLTVILARNKTMNIWLRVLFIAVAWIAYLLMAAYGNADGKTNPPRTGTAVYTVLVNERAL